MKVKKYLSIVLAGTFWGGCFYYSYNNMLQFETTPGTAAKAPHHWPAKIGVYHSAEKATLLMLLHPLCPCSKASVTELERLLAELHDYIEVSILFVVPPTLNANDLMNTELWRQIQAIPGAHSRIDPDGLLSKRFGTFTSGETLIYSPNGELIFSGGITATRGHPGDSPGSNAIREIIINHKSEKNSFSVFGCDLL
jgi:hypothetical protein